MSELASRTVAESRVEMTEIVMPNDGNPLGNAMGGRVMHWLDVCAAVCAGRHARTPVVTASVDNVDFHNPVPIGSVLVLLASVNYTGRTSMEIGVKCWQEERSTGERTHVVSAYLTFVSLNPETRKPKAVPAIKPITDDEKRRYAEAAARRQARLALRK